MSIYHRFGSLFSGFDLRQHLERLAAEMHSEAGEIDADRLLGTPTADLVDYFVEKYSLEVPVLRADEWSASQQEVQVDVSRDGNRWFRDDLTCPLSQGHLLLSRVQVGEHTAPVGQISIGG